MNRGLRILFATPYVPSPVRVRPYAFIRELAARGHEVTLACLVQPASEEKFLSDVSQYCRAVHPIHLGRLRPYWNAVASLPTGTPMSVAYCRSDEASEVVRGLADSGGYDLLHTEFVRAAPLTAGLDGLPSVFDAVDSVSLAYRRSISAAHVPPRQRLVSLVEWAKMRRFEPRVMRKFDRVLVSSPADRDALERGGENGVAVIPNGVDAGYFAFHDGPRDDDTLMFLGKMSYYVNVAAVRWFCQEVLPLIRRQRPNARFKIVGRDPEREIMALAGDGIEVTGTVPDVRPHLAGAAVSVCPMVTGSGIQNKMLEAMAVGAPTVSTTIACQALSVEPGRDVLVADKPEAFADCVVTLLNDGELRRRMAANARRYVEQHHDWRTIGCRLEEIYNGLLSGNQTGQQRTS